MQKLVSHDTCKRMRLTRSTIVCARLLEHQSTCVPYRILSMDSPCLEGGPAHCESLGLDQSVLCEKHGFSKERAEGVDKAEETSTQI